MAFLEDRWLLTATGPDGKRLPSDRHGKGLRYRVRYTDPSGAHRAKSFARVEAARQFRATVEADVLRGSYIDPDAGRVTLRAYGEEWVARVGGEATTREHVRIRCGKHIFPPLGHHTLGHLAQRPSIIAAWLRDLRLADSYKRVLFAHLSAMLTDAVDNGLIARNPCKAQSVKPPGPDKRKISAWRPEWVAAVREGLPERYRVLVDIGAGLGLRQGEAFGLGKEDIDWFRNAVHIRRQVRWVSHRPVFALPKGGREREMPLPESVKLRLSAHLAAFPAASVTLPWSELDGKPRTVPLIVTSTARGPVNRSHFDRKVWRPAALKAGTSGTREDGFHALRHFYASVLLRGGEDVRTVAEYLGHTDPGFTLRVYGHFIPGGGERTRRIIDDVFSGAGEDQGRTGGENDHGIAR